jgi:4-amino-4-deoxy-L-arabinose transferase-like glycosyltransferase
MILSACLTAALAFAVELYGYVPGPYTLLAEQVTALLLVDAIIVAVALLVYGLWKFRPDLHRPIIFILLLTLAVLTMHLYTINAPSTADCFDHAKNVPGCIMDEVYYVPSAQGLLAGNQCAPYADSCNLEHPPLAKGLIAAGIATFGLNTFGWRISTVLLGTLSIPLLFVLVLVMKGTTRLAYVASLLLAADTMFFAQSSAALIDVQPVFFTLLSFIAYFAAVRVWKFDKYIVAGALMGLAVLSKETAVFMLGALVTYDALTARKGVKEWAIATLKMSVVAGGIFILGLQAYDTLYAASSFPTFIQHIRFMLSYGSSLTGPLKCQPAAGYFCLFPNDPGGAPILPIHWLVFFTPTTYYGTTVSSGSLSWVGIGYYGVPNMLTVWLVYFWVPLLFYTFYRERKTGLPSLLVDTRNTNVTRFTFVWFLWGFVPYLLLTLYGRVTYPFYMIPIIPALAVGAGYAVTSKWFSKPVVYVLLIAAFAWFFYYYPDKAFLPEWVRAVLNR